MAVHEFTLDAIDEGENPYYSMKTPYVIGTDTIDIFAGKSIKVPNIWDIISVGVDIDTDATVADRYANINIFGPDGVDYILCGVKSAAIPASQTGINLQITPLVFLSTSVSLPVEYMGGMSYPIPLIGEKGKIRVTLTTGKAGDQFKLNVLVKFKNYELGMKKDFDNSWFRPY